MAHIDVHNTTPQPLKAHAPSHPVRPQALHRRHQVQTFGAIVRVMMAAVVAVVVACLGATGLVADPAWFPRDVMAYAEIKRPNIQVSEQGIATLLDQMGLEGEKFGAVISSQFALSEGLSRTELAFVDVRLDMDSPISFQSVMHYARDLTREECVRMLLAARSAAEEESLDESKVEYGSYGDHQLASLKSAGVYLAVGNRRLLQAQSESSLKSLIDAINGELDDEESLTSNVRFAQWHKETSLTTSTARAFIDASPILRLLDQVVEREAATDPDVAAGMATDMYLRWRNAKYASIVVGDDDRMTSRIEIVMKKDPEWAPILSGTVKHVGLKYAHPQSVFVASGGVEDLSAAASLGIEILLKSQAEYASLHGGPTDPPRKVKNWEGNEREEEKRDLFGRRYPTGEYHFDNVRKAIRNGWQEAATRFAAKRPNDLPIEITSKELAEITGLPWVDASLFGFQPGKVSIGAFDAEARRYAGTVEYVHADGSTISVDFLQEGRVKVSDPALEVDDSERPKDASGAPMSESEHRILRRRGRMISSSDVVVGMRTAVCMDLRSTEEELLNMVAGSVVVGVAPASLDLRMSSSHSLEMEGYVIVPLKSHPRLKQVLEYAALSEGEVGFDKGDSRDLLEAIGTIWAHEHPELGFAFTKFGYSRSVAFTGDALIFADPSLMPGILESGRAGGAPAIMDLANRQEPVVAYTNTRWITDRSYMKAIRMKNSLDDAEAPEFTATASVGYLRGRLAIEFRLGQPLDLAAIRIKSDENDRDEQLEKQQEEGSVVARIGYAMMKLVRENGSDAKSVTWTAAAEAAEAHLLKVIESSQFDERGEEWRESARKEVEELFKGRSAVFPEDDMSECWEVLVSPQTDYEKAFSDPNARVVVRPIAVSRSSTHGGKWVVMSVAERAYFENVKEAAGQTPFVIDETQWSTAYMVWMESSLIDEIMEARKADGLIPHSLTLPTRHVVLSDFEAAIVIPDTLADDWWKEKLAEVVSPEGKWLDESKDVVEISNHGVIRRITKAKDATSNANGEPDKADPTPTTHPNAVARAELYGHWALIDAEGNILASSWVENITGKAAKQGE